MCLWLARPVLLRLGCTRAACATRMGFERSALRAASLSPGSVLPPHLQQGFCSRPRHGRLRAPCAKFWSRDRLPHDADPHDPWGNDSDVEDDYSPPLEKQFDSAKASAAASLSFRPHSRAELKHKLRDKGFDSALATRALDRLEELGMLSDAQFAETFARSKWRQARWAPSRIRMELSRRGLAKADIESGLHAVFGSDLNSVQLCPPGAEECELDDMAHEPERASLAIVLGRATGPGCQLAALPGLDRQLLEAVRRQAHLSRGLPRETRRRRLVAWLQRRGHTWGTVSALIQELHM